MRIQLLAVLLAALVPAVAMASPAPMAIDEIVSQQQQIRSDVLAANGRYRDMPTATRDELVRRQDDLFRLFEGKRDPSDLSDEERLLASTNLEWIETALADAQDEQKVCRAERTLGSNRITRVCRTAAQMAAERERAREDLVRGQAGKP